MVKIFNIKAEYVLESGLFVLNTDKLKLPFKVKENNVVYFPPGEIGGNHKHPRFEAFITIGPDMELIWIDKPNKKHNLSLNGKGKLSLVVIYPYTPHAVINKSKKCFGVIFEYASDKQSDVECLEILKK